jgi:MoaA/NifB/PqqE/SkfB family radical SAM enzyme
MPNAPSSSDARPALTPTDYYRLPRTLNDNVLSWLEPTKKCNIYCEGCYSTNETNSHKTLDQIRRDMDTFVAHRRMDSVSIAGGDPLTHPGIVDIVRMIRKD